MKKGAWDSHYKKEKSVLSYPDENLVRMLMKELPQEKNRGGLIALDLGCGTGRHLKLLDDMNISYFFGFDASFNALEQCRKFYNYSLTQNKMESLALKNESVDIIIAWGSLHYDYKTKLQLMLNEIIRVLKPGGKLLATLRSDRDTYLKIGKYLVDNTWQTDLKDLNGSIVSFYDESELNRYFNKFFHLKYGLMERTLLGDMQKIISHWVLLAVK